MVIFEILHDVSAVLLSVVGFNAIVLSIIYLIVSKRKVQRPADPVIWPSVVVQLPIYNELHVVERLVESVNKLVYPRDKLTVQLLDDSTDETVGIAAQAVERARQLGLSIEHIRREVRTGFKAGALAYGFDLSDAEFIAVFDADFVPEPDFLTQVIPYLAANDKLGMAQTRWSHLNAEHSLLTRAQALGLDHHFVIEQTARQRSGLLMNFAGTGGVWRKACIEDSGGWESDTLSEDIDLSYRAQLNGWEVIYLPDIGTPSEITPLMMGFKQQQARWATGTVQCLRKIGWRVFSSPRLNAWQKAQALLHLAAYFIHPLMMVLLLTSLPLILSGSADRVSLAGLGFAMLGAPLASLIAQHHLYKDWPKRLAYFPLMMVVGVGIAVSNTQAVLRGLSSNHQPFLRTPKFHLSGKGGRWHTSGYTVPVDGATWIEVALAIYAAATAVIAWRESRAFFPLMALYALGLLGTAGLSLWQAGAIRESMARRHSLELSGNNP